MTTELDRALRQLHSQLLAMVKESLASFSHDHAEVSDGGKPSSNSAARTASDEFLHFLETQSRTQVKILEVELRAGQELLRVHKTQFEKERSEVRACTLHHCL